MHLTLLFLLIPVSVSCVNRFGPHIVSTGFSEVRNGHQIVRIFISLTCLNNMRSHSGQGYHAVRLLLQVQLYT